MGRNSTIMPREQRLEVIKQYLPEGYTYEEIAEKCNCHEQTIKNDMKYFRDQGGFDAWLMKEFFDMYDEVKALDKVVAFKGIMQILMRTMPTRQKIDVNKQIEHTAGSGLVEMVKDLLREDRELPKEIDADYHVKEPEALEAQVEDG